MVVDFTTGCDGGSCSLCLWLFVAEGVVIVVADCRYGFVCRRCRLRETKR